MKNLTTQLRKSFSFLARKTNKKATSVLILKGSEHLLPYIFYV